MAEKMRTDGEIAGCLGILWEELVAGENVDTERTRRVVRYACDYGAFSSLEFLGIAEMLLSQGLAELAREMSGDGSR